MFEDVVYIHTQNKFFSIIFYLTQQLRITIVSTEYTGHTIVHTQQFTPFKCDLISIFYHNIHTCTYCRTFHQVLYDAQNNRNRRQAQAHMLMTTILLVLLGPHFTQDLRSCATRLLLSFAHSCFFRILSQFAWNTVKPIQGLLIKIKLFSFSIKWTVSCSCHCSR